MDDDPVLRALGAQLQRDDPGLAALLEAGPNPAPNPAPTPVLPEPAVDPLPPEVFTWPPPGVLAWPPPNASRRARRRRRPPAWAVVVLAVLLVGAVSRLGLAAFGVLGLLALVSAPVVAFWWCASADDLRPPDRPDGGRDPR